MNKVIKISGTNDNPQASHLLQSPVAIPYPYQIFCNGIDYDSNSDSNDNSNSEDNNDGIEKRMT